jgi:hypothetical protein
MIGKRTRVFDPDGRYVRQVDTPPLVTPRTPGIPGYVAGMAAAYGTGSFLAYPGGNIDVEAGIGPASYRHLLLRLAPDGASWDTLGVFPIDERHWDGTNVKPLWFGAIAVMAVGTDDLHFGRARSFEIERYDESGRLARIVRRVHQARPVTQSDKDDVLEWYLGMVGSSSEATPEVIERVRQDFSTANFAETLPPYSHMLVDDERNLWVEEFRWFPGIDRSPIQGPATWSMFDPEGIWLGTVETPPGFILRDVARDRALGFRVDDLGVKIAEVYRLERPAS